MVSSGKNNKFGHPSDEALKRVELVGSQVLRTDQLGDVVIVSDGVSYWVR